MATKEEVKAVMQSVTTNFRKKFSDSRTSNLGAINPRTGEPKKGEFRVGLTPALQELTSGISQLQGLGVKATKKSGAILPINEGGLKHMNTSANPGQFLRYLINQRAKLDSRNNEVSAALAPRMAGQREAIQANAAIMAGRRTASSARVPRSARAAGLLLPNTRGGLL